MSTDLQFSQLRISCSFSFSIVFFYWLFSSGKYSTTETPSNVLKYLPKFYKSLAKYIYYQYFIGASSLSFLISL